MDIFSIQNLSLFLATLLCGLLAGLFYGYSCSVNNGLGRLNDPGYLKAMRSINKVYKGRASGSVIQSLWLKYSTFNIGHSINRVFT